MVLGAGARQMHITPVGWPAVLRLGAALEMYEAHKPDVVLMDLRMPQMDGVDAIERIREAHPDARIVALTSYEGDADIYRVLNAGAYGYLLKDMLGTELVIAVRAAAAGKRVIPPEVAARLAEFTPRADLTERDAESSTSTLSRMLSAPSMPARPTA